VTTSLGFGRHFTDIDPKVLPYIGLVGNFSGLFAILAAMLSKISFAITLFRISERRMRVVLCFVIATVFIALGCSALFAWIQCTPIARNWDYTVKGTCWNPRVYVTEGVISGGL
jgi:Fungal rhodopsin domain